MPFPHFLKVYDNAFNGCSKLSEFDFSNVLYLGTGSFRATLISDINLSKVEVIKTLAFANCNLLSKVYINPNVKELGNDVFKGTLNIIDIRSHYEYLLGKIPTAINIDKIILLMKNQPNYIHTSLRITEESIYNVSSSYSIKYVSFNKFNCFITSIL